MKTRIVFVSFCVAAALPGCGKKKSKFDERKQLCVSYCDFVKMEKDDERTAAKQVVSFGGAHAPPAASDIPANVLLDQAREGCVHLHEALARRHADERARDRADTIMSSRTMSLTPPPNDHAPDCRTASPAQLRAFATEYEKTVPPEDDLGDNLACQDRCEYDLASKLAAK